MDAAADAAVKLELSLRALREAEGCAQWWRAHRPEARELFEEELRAALDQIRTAPRLGTAYHAMGGREYRRVLMPRTRHHVYYRVVGSERGRIVAVWGAPRGRGPRL